ncbi:NAD(P)-binding protein [Pholiota conissans]|uniref:NAD(P)-binding protein n=1 Tax=Pholiota conissans TaxID=109636 RepID=A0A9P5YQJ7_9AGAR|nr:NAD(P)-binding protein [Pholiota conissans]
MFWSKKFDPSRDLADLTGKVVIVTGANTGIGYSTVKHLARKGAKVYLGARSEEKGKAAVEKLQGEGIGAGEVVWLPCSFNTPAQAKEAAEHFLKLENRLDILVNNAGCTGDDKPAQDGITEMMMVNHIGTFQFTTSLLPLLQKTSEDPAADVRIITLASDAHRQGVATKPDLDFKSLDIFRNFFNDDRIPYFSRYFISKLANVLFTNALQRKLSSSNPNIICISLNPGLVKTSISEKSGVPFFMFILVWLFSVPPDEGAYNSCFAAASPLVRQDAEKYKGAYLEPVGKIGKAAANALRTDLQDDLWKTTEEYLESSGAPANEE